ncbi:MAG TPA: hypothetical protein VIO16_14570, partial [Dehalococcoidia bacterium]
MDLCDAGNTDEDKQWIHRQRRKGARGHAVDQTIDAGANHRDARGPEPQSALELLHIDGNLLVFRHGVGPSPLRGKDRLRPPQR